MSGSVGQYENGLYSQNVASVFLGDLPMTLIFHEQDYLDAFCLTQRHHEGLKRNDHE